MATSETEAHGVVFCLNSGVKQNKVGAAADVRGRKKDVLDSMHL